MAAKKNNDISKGARIKLIKMNDPYAPVPPGTLGTVKHIDSAGQLHMEWDNGRTLALVPGVDRFYVIPSAPPMHYVVAYEYGISCGGESEDYCNGTEIIAVVHSSEKAAQVLKEKSADEREFALEHGWIVVHDNNETFYAHDSKDKREFSYYFIKPVTETDAQEDGLISFLKQEVPYRLKEHIELPEELITPALVEACIEYLHNNSDLMFNYDDIDDALRSCVSETEGISFKADMPVCDICGRELAVEISANKLICSSDYIEGWPTCRSCMSEYCVETHCLGCEYNPGNYKECRFYADKMQARFVITETSDAFPDPDDAFAIQDTCTGKYVVNAKGDILTFATEEQAAQGLISVQKAYSEDGGKKKKHVVVSQGIKIAEFDTPEEANAYANQANTEWLEYKQGCLDAGEPYADNQCFVYEEDL